MRAQLGQTTLSDSELDLIWRDYRARRRIDAAQGTNPSQAASAYATRRAEQLRIEGAQQRRNAANNAIKGHVWVQTETRFATTRAWAEAALDPSNLDVQGARESAAGKQKSYFKKYAYGFWNRVRAEKLEHYVRQRMWDIVNPRKWGKGPIDDDTSIEVANLSLPEAERIDTGNGDAKKLAKIIYDFQELVRADLNRLGAAIGKVPGYIIMQTHDMVRVGRKSFDEWRAAAEEAYGNARTYEGLTLTGDDAADANIITEFWRSMYDDIRYGRHNVASAAMTGFRGVGDRAKALSRHRVLYPNSAKHWIKYNDQFGATSLMEGLFNSFRRASRAAGLMEKFGTNPKQQFFDGIKTVERRRQARGLPPDRDVAEGGITSRLWDTVDGQSDIPLNITLAHIGSVARFFQTIAKLGGAVAASLGDITTATARIADLSGRGTFEVALEHIKGRFAQITDQGRQREMASLMFVGSDSELMDINRFAGPDEFAYDAVHKTQNFYFKANLLTMSTESSERQTAAQLNALVATQQDLAWDDLAPDFRQELRLANVSSSEWNFIRKHGRYLYKDTTPMLLSDKLRDAPLESVDDLVEHDLENLRLQSLERGKRTSQHAEAASLRIRRLTNTLGRQGELGDIVGGMRALADRARDIGRRSFEHLQGGFERPIGALADAIHRFSNRARRDLDQHVTAIARVGERERAALEAEPGLTAKFDDAFEELQETQHLFDEAVEELLTGSPADPTRAAHLKRRVDRVTDRINKFVDAAGSGERFREIREGMEALSEYVTTLHDAEYRDIVAKHRTRIVKTISTSVAREARENERILIHNRNQINERVADLRRHQRAEPAVLDRIATEMGRLDELIASLRAEPARLEARLNNRRALAIQEVETRWSTFLIDMVHQGVLRGGAREKQYGTRGARTGTVHGELFRSMSQFKQYPMAFVQQTLGRYAQEDKFTKIVPALLKRAFVDDPYGTGVKVAKLFTHLLVLGYVTQVLKDLATGKEPQDPTRLDTWGRAALQSGALGVYGDYLFYNAGRDPSTAAFEAIGGPVPSAIVEGIGLGFLQPRDALLNWDSNELPNDERVFQYFKENGPFLNLIYMRAALDYLILYDLQESLSPGSLERMEQRLRDERGQKHFVPPTER
jgi:hypothetical protein